METLAYAKKQFMYRLDYGLDVIYANDRQTKNRNCHCQNTHVFHWDLAGLVFHGQLMINYVSTMHNLILAQD